MSVPRYVVLHHTEVADPHFDLLFEWEPGEALTSFHCPSWPPAVGDVWEERPDHRRLYLDFEGDLSGGRGHVRRVAAGAIEHAVLASDPPTLGMAFGDEFSLTIANHVVPGDATLTRWVVESLDA